jgi:ankyrin repeat protein
MFPNPQDALSLPPRPSLERYRKLAEDLVKAAKSDTVGAWTTEWLRGLATRVSFVRNAGPIEEFAKAKMANGQLADAQFVIARAHGFQNWAAFSSHLSAVANARSTTSRFEAAADAIVTGNIAKLRRLLRENPELTRAVSTREHGATLLHYVAANGVENYRQKTPPNIVEITGMLLDAGAEVDATAEMYGGKCTALGLAATSIHPERAAVQDALLQTLLDRGANLEQPLSAGQSSSLILACLGNNRYKAAQFLATRGASLDLIGTAALGRLEEMESLLENDEAKLDQAFVFACRFGQLEAATFLLKKGADLTAHTPDLQTPIHWAVIGGHVDVVRFLLKHNAPLEAKNIYGGTVLGQTLWSARNGQDPDVTIQILAALLAAGAKLPSRREPVNPRVDQWLAGHRD